MGAYDEMVAAGRRGDYGTALRLARQRRGWSQVVLGQRVGYDGSTISHFEAGRAKLPDLQTVESFADILGVPPMMLGAARFGTTVAEGEDDVRRRQMLLTAGLVLTGVPLGSASSELPRRVDITHAEDIRAKTDQFRIQVYHAGAERQVRHGITTLLDYTTALIPQASHDQVRRHLLDALGEIAGLAAYAYRDLGRHQHAQEHYLLALQAARAAGDAPLVGHLVVRMAGHQIELKDPAMVLNHLQAARNTGRVFSPGELSNQCAIAAWAQAQKNNPQHVHRHIGLAEEHFTDRPAHATAGTHPQRGWQIRHTAEAELYSLTGAAYSELARQDPRHAAEAVRRLQLALTLRADISARNTTLDMISLAEAHLAAHDLDQSLTASVTALNHAQGSFSRRVRMRLAELAQRLVAHQKRTDVAEIIGQIEMLRGPARPSGS